MQKGGAREFLYCAQNKMGHEGIFPFARIIIDGIAVYARICKKIFTGY